MNKILNIVKLFMFCCIVFFMGFTYSFFIKKQNVINKELIITKGAKPQEIYKKLGIHYSIFDRVYFKLTTNDRKIKDGYFLFDQNISKYEIMSIISNAKNTEVVLTIPEGFTSEEVLNRIEKLGLSKKSEMLNAMKNYSFYYKSSDNFEGYLLPQTYYITKGATPKEILDKILGLFLKKYPSSKYKKDEMNKYIILASIIEKEAKQDEDRAKIAAVFLNRINKDMPLQSDATLKYDLKRDVLKEDLKTNKSPYNTYIHKGLTPTPICNPGEKSIEASMKPEKNFDKLYFFMYKDKTYYSSTHEEHLEKRKESGHIK